MLLGFLSDAHGNTTAFQKGVAILHAESVQQLFFLGDAVGYIPDGGVVVALREMGVAAVRGNHDEMMLRGDATVERRLVYRHEETARQLTADERAFVAGWPIERRIVIAGSTCLLIHGSPSAPMTGYIYPDADLAPFKDVDADVVFMGNTHHPFVRAEYGKLFVNVGSCGLPREAGRQASVCLFDAVTRSAKIIRYSIAADAARILKVHDLDDSVASLLREITSEGMDRVSGI